MVFPAFCGHFRAKSNDLKSRFLGGPSQVGGGATWPPAPLSPFSAALILTEWNTFMKISHRKDRRSVNNDRDVMYLPAHEVTVVIFTFKMCFKHFHSTKQQNSAYLSQIL